MYCTAFWCLIVVYCFFGFIACYSFYRTKGVTVVSPTVTCNATPARHLWYVNYITPFPRNVSLGHLCSCQLKTCQKEA